MGAGSTLSCSRGKANPNQHTRLRLFADSAGYCQNPSCARQLFVDTPSKNIHVAEIAHIFAASDDGPRANAQLDEEERRAYENLILLCADCHTTVDKAPEAYPDTLIREWKRDRTDRLNALFGALELPSRAEVRNLINPLMAENEAILRRYGPVSDSRLNPESDAPETWRRKVLVHLIPNNQRILAILDKNRALMVGNEPTVLEDFRQHVDDLRARHLENIPGGRRYPEAMNDMMLGDG